MAHVNPTLGDPGSEWPLEINTALDAIDANADSRIPKSLVTQQGDLLVGAASGDVERLAASNVNGRVLATDLTGSGVARLKWIDPPTTTSTPGGPGSDTTAIHNTIADAAGDLIVGTGSDTVARLGKGTNGQVLTAGTSTVAWATPVTGNKTYVQSGTPSAPNTGDLWIAP